MVDEYIVGIAHPANMRRWHNVCLLLAHRLRRWPNSKPALGQRLMFAAQGYISLQSMTLRSLSLSITPLLIQ